MALTRESLSRAMRYLYGLGAPLGAYLDLWNAYYHDQPEWQVRYDPSR